MPHAKTSAVAATPAKMLLCVIALPLWSGVRQLGNGRTLVDDLNTPVCGIERVVRHLQPLLSETDGVEPSGLDLESVHQELSDAFGPALRQHLIVFSAAFGISVAGDE